MTGDLYKQRAVDAADVIYYDNNKHNMWAKTNPYITSIRI